MVVVKRGGWARPRGHEACRGAETSTHMPFSRQMPWLHPPASKAEVLKASVPTWQPTSAGIKKHRKCAWRVWADSSACWSVSGMMKRMRWNQVGSNATQRTTQTCVVFQKLGKGKQWPILESSIQTHVSTTFATYWWIWRIIQEAYTMAEQYGGALVIIMCPHIEHRESCAFGVDCEPPLFMIILRITTMCLAPKHILYSCVLLH